MDSAKPALDLEKELTCSICTELLYQPLTLLDCLHTFCGACLKDWFAFQADAARDAPTPPPPGTPVFTCPACRAAVRGTRHNATVATLLDMYLGANPDRDRTEAEKREIAERYTRGDDVLPKMNTDKSPEQLRAEEEDRRIVEEVRMLSLSEVGVDSGLSPYRAGGRRGVESSRSRDGSRDARASRRSGDERQGRHRRPRHRSESRSQPGGGGARPEDSSADSRSRARQVEHQSSIRSLIGTADMSERDIEREIEEFARQIQEEGILDGLDLDNIDLTRDDDLSRRITEAYRRRQRERERERGRERERERERERQEGATRRHTESGGSSSEVNLPGTLQLRRDDRFTGQRRNSTGAHGAAEDNRAPNSSRTPLLEVQPDERRRRRRTASSGRSSTAPIAPSPRGVPAAAARSHTDLALQTRHVDPSNPRSVLSENRTSSSPTVTVSNHAPSQGSNLSFASRVPLQIQAHANTQAQAQAVSSPEPSPSLTPRPHRPADLSLSHSTHSSPLPSPASSSLGTTGRKRTPPVLFTEPSITCDRCAQPHIEYTLHYNCALCNEGNFNICLDCYRSSRGCLHWFGFGYGALMRWEKRRRDDPSLAPHHRLVPHRYLPPQSQSQPAKTDGGGSGGTRVQTAEDPVQRLQTGTFCDGCFAWTNTCWWRCRACNEGDWGFCDACVNKGRCCTHPLLPLSHQPSSSARKASPASPRPLNLPRRAALLPNSLGDFRPLVFVTRCEVCQEGIPPTQSRHHCFECTSTLERDSLPGEHEICVSCYSGLVSRGQVSPENGPGGWRRCLAGHRMAVLAFEERSEGHYRYTVQDIVGGRRLRMEDGVEGSSSVAKWSWKQDGRTLARLVTTDVSKTAGGGRGGEADGAYTHQFPPGGGTGRRAAAKYMWFRQGEEAKGELCFPKNAEITEVEDVNGDWFEGSYMGEVGYFPAPYVEQL